MGVEEIHIAPRSPWQNCYAKRIIGSIRRECLNHVIVINEWHRRQILKSYFGYYNRFILPYLTMCLKNRSCLVSKLVQWGCGASGGRARAAVMRPQSEDRFCL
jgi:hypothetical protein